MSPQPSPRGSRSGCSGLFCRPQRSCRRRGVTPQQPHLASRILKQDGLGRHQQYPRLGLPLQQGEGLETPIGSEFLTWSRLTLGRHGHNNLRPVLFHSYSGGLPSASQR